ncbi:sigma factor-like helix-turn-helix DNA-binding protein [Pseudonocardia spinosispora]|uniref:sigma factor-like helix-turn-helix DNA-binding protein n=1 Tax=Pseudonocardia spinosispora TaxID=103441 RepID=UPI000426D762|nr:sigma factor-like helix-turn-helix DNA-binding protein [Pseudonocardia spinosispora]
MTGQRRARHAKPKSTTSPTHDFPMYFRSAFPPMVAQLHAILADGEQAQRVTRRAFADAAARWTEVSAMSDASSWVRGRALRHARRSTRLRHLPILRTRYPANPIKPTVPLLSALSELPEVQRRTLVLHYLAKLSPERIAEEEGVSEQTIALRLGHARVALGHKLTLDQTSSGDVDISSGRWATASIDDWVARQLSYLELRLTPRPGSLTPPAPARRLSWNGRAGVALGVVTVVLGASAAVTVASAQPQQVPQLLPPGLEAVSDGPAVATPAPDEVVPAAGSHLGTPGDPRHTGGPTSPPEPLPFIGTDHTRDGELPRRPSATSTARRSGPTTKPNTPQTPAKRPQPGANAGPR